MAYCWKCGRELSPGAKFCPYCGAPVKTITPNISSEDDTAEKISSNSASFRNADTEEKTAEVSAKPKKEKKTVKKVQEIKPDKKELKRQQKAEKKAAKLQRKAEKKERKAQKKQKKKRSFLGWIFRLIRNLIIINVVFAIVVVSLFHFGIIDENFDLYKEIRMLMNKVEDLTVHYEDEPEDALNNDDPELITIRYSDSEVRNAESVTSEVTVEKPKVKVGNVTVDMGLGNLMEKDTLIVKDLGRKDDDSMGMALHCYDFSLASGTDQFPSLVTITIPLKLGEREYLDGVVYFNEDTKQWEDLMYDVSSNNKNVIIYIDHFTKVSPKIGKMTTEMFEAVQAANSGKKHSSEYIKSKDGDTAIPANLFVEAWNKVRQTKDMDYVYFSAYPTMRNIAIHNDTLRSLFSLNNQSVQGTADSIRKSINKLDSAVKAKELDWPSRAIGIGESTTGALNDFSVLNGLLSTGGKVFSEVSGKMIAGLNIIVTGIKVFLEIDAGKSVDQAWEDNQLAIIGAGISALGLLVGSIAGLACWPVTMIGIGLCATSLSLDLYKYSEGLDELPMHEQAYLAYYSYKAKDTSKIHDGSRIGFDKEKFKCVMELPEGMLGNEKDSVYKNIMSEVGKNGLGEEWVWNSILRMIFRKAESDPDSLQKNIDDLLYKYADAYWNLSQKERDNWTYLWMHDQGYEEEDIQAVLDSKVMKSDIETYRKDMMNLFLYQLSPILEQQVKLYISKSFTAFKKEINKEFIQPLNNMIYFHVDDQTLEKGQTFADSIYAQDYRFVEFNKENYFKKIEFGDKKHITEYYPVMKNEMPVYMDVVTPMRFVGVNYPLFYPYQVTWDNYQLFMDKVTRMDRYPHEPEYLPWVNTRQNSPDIVFACNVYHYIQMGQPTRMLFKDVSTVDTWEDAQRYYDDPGIEVSFTIPKFNSKGQSHVRIKVTGQGELSQYEGYWESNDWFGSSKQWYHFTIDTELKSIDVVDTFGLPSEFYTIRRYKFDSKTKTLKYVLGWLKDRATYEFKLTGKNTMVLYIDLNGESTSFELTRSTRERYEDWSNRQKFYIPDYDALLPPGDE